ncbi:hypothetical protein K488DRAFT_82656 [Vararia minispora EC-137]|uniref:Uncharacterized protein n=1 Tax=Vararia minispora EC-137 TaxID=1314806 RepID=A0ACB8QW28_9AGAM|nr:hypothetical protein K488DRAFT_82656 [Vararia minispora EC-137]
MAILSLPRIPDLPAYPTLLVISGLVLTLYTHINRDRALNFKHRVVVHTPALDGLSDKSQSESTADILDKSPAAGSPPPILRAEAPVFRPRKSSVGPTNTVWTNIPDSARELRARAEKEYQAGCEYKFRAEAFNAEASKQIYEAKNKNPQSGWIDLHGLYATEAVMFAGRAVDEAQERGDATVKFIVG